MAVMDVRFCTARLPVSPDARLVGVKNLKIESTFLIEFDPQVTDIEMVEQEVRVELEEFWKDFLTEAEEDLPTPEITFEIHW